MKIKSGVDIVKVNEFKTSLRAGGESFRRRVFLESEWRHDHSIVHLAGVFAAKEAVTKALSLGPGSWLKIEITYEKSGRPVVHLGSKLKPHSWDLSISHTKETAVAVFVAIL